MQTLQNYDQFIINDCGVCINPILVGVQVNRHNIMANFLRVGQIDGKWYTGYSYDNDDASGGAGSPVTKTGNGYDSPEDALLDLIDKLEKRNKFDNLQMFKKTIDKAKEEIMDYLHPQLTLF